MRIDLLKKLIDIDDLFELHLVRILILIFILTEKNYKNKKVEGITKLVKLDFLLRYPIALERALKHNNKDTKIEISDYEKTSVESRMIRYKYGPWDKRYRLFLSILDALGFLRVVNEKETVIIEITKSGIEFTKEVTNIPDFVIYAERSRIIKANFGDLSATNLKNMMYDIIPELKVLRLGDIISI